MWLSEADLHNWDERGVGRMLSRSFALEGLIVTEGRDI